jgi:predicted deacylase
VRRGPEEGPVVFITAALHGDEINGTGAIRELVRDDGFRLHRGAVILIPVLNILGFERHSRYLPDRRDLNRCFPGFASGSLASRMARILFTEVVGRADFGIDLHTAALRRTNFPNVRADMTDPAVVRLAEAFGSEIVLDGKGPKGAFRREACKAGCPTIIFEGGEVWKVEPTIVEYALRGVRNVLADLGMIAQASRRAQHQVTIRRTKWVRADRGGFLQFHVAPGDIVERRQPIATNTSLLGRDRNVLDAPFDGIVLGMTTLPAISPGEPVVHLGRLTDAADLQRLREAAGKRTLTARTVMDLASNVLVVDPAVGGTAES